MRRMLRKPEYGMNWNLAQKLPIPTDGRFWLVPANGFLCLVVQKGPNTGNQVCSETKEVLGHGLFVTFLAAHPKELVYGARRFILGVVPDYARKVGIDTDGSKVMAPVDEGVFVRRDSASASPSRLILAGAGR
jgi:hypothetical protein